MSFEQIESFIAVAEEGAFVRAAARLYVTQPPLTRRIQQLEGELGVALFERHARGVRLTSAGLRFFPHAVAVIQAARAATAAARAAPPTDAT
jgi:DNA-binding transcriptional LysR family regulator